MIDFESRGPTDTPVPVVTYIGGATVTGANPATFTSRAIGDADATRIVFVVVSYGRYDGSDTWVTGLTIGGVEATEMSQHYRDLGGSTYGCAIYALAVPTGTTATIVVSNGTTGWYYCDIGVYSVTGTSGVALHDTQSDDTNSATKSVDIDVPAGGFTLGAANCYDYKAFTWTNLGEDYDAAASASYARHTSTFAHDDNMDADAALAVTTVCTGAAGGTLHVSSFR